MSYKFTLRDVVLEASEREFFSTMPDYEWVSSEKHTAAIKKLFERKPEDRRGYCFWKELYSFSSL